MLELSICSREDCDGIVFVDRTGPYNALTRPGGYGPENDIESPSDFLTYVLSIWAPDLDPVTDDPTYTKNLLLSVPAPTEDGYYEWDITAAEMGLTLIRSGVWFMEVLATGTGGPYAADTSPIFTHDVRDTVVNPAMLAWDPTCPCKEGCEDPGRLFMALRIVQCDGVCDAVKTRNVINWLYTASICC